MSESITVESCLAELREMFPLAYRIAVEERAFYYDGKQGHGFWIKLQGPGVPDNYFRDQSLAATLAQVRAWKESQQ